MSLCLETSLCIQTSFAFPTDGTFEMVDGQHRFHCMQQLWASGRWQPKADEPPLTAATMKWPVVVVNADATICSKIAMCKFSLSLVFTLCSSDVLCTDSPRLLLLCRCEPSHLSNIIDRGFSRHNAPPKKNARAVLSGVVPKRLVLLTVTVGS